MSTEQQQRDSEQQCVNLALVFRCVAKRFLEACQEEDETTEEGADDRERSHDDAATGAIFEAVNRKPELVPRAAAALAETLAELDLMDSTATGGRDEPLAAILEFSAAQGKPYFSIVDGKEADVVGKNGEGTDG